MININSEVPKDVWDDTAAHENVALTLGQEKELLLKEAEIALGNLYIKKLELENIGVDDEISRNELKRINSEIAKHETLVESFTGNIHKME